MSDEHEDRPSADSVTPPPVDTSRRRFLGGAAVLGVGATLGACGDTRDAPGKPVARPLTPQERPPAAALPLLVPLERLLHVADRLQIRLVGHRTGERLVNQRRRALHARLDEVVRHFQPLP